MLELRKQGLSFREIAEELNCAKSTVSYFFREAQRDKTREREKQYEY